MSTPHLQGDPGDYAKTVLMPGDPLRAQFIAETFLSDVKQVNAVRGMLGFTGTYKGVPVSVQGSGMGCPSMGIYSYELFHFFGVERIIRVGTTGSIHENLTIGDLCFAQGACSTSNYLSQYGLPGTFAPIASYPLLRTAESIAQARGCRYMVGNVLSSDFFYDDIPATELWRKMGVLALEMESTALYANAARAGKEALTILTVSDELLTGRETSPLERQTAFTAMMEVALETALAYSDAAQ